MKTLLLRTKVVIEDCESHLESTKSGGSEIENYLTQHIVIILCAEMQQEVYRILDERAGLSKDEGLCRFSAAAGQRILRSVRKDDLANFVEFFGKAAKDQFNSAVDDRDVTIYNNAVNIRHDIAHKSGGTVSFKDVKDAVVVAGNILEALKTAIHTGTTI